MMQSVNVVENIARKLYLDPTKKGSGRALKPFYDRLIEEGKINKKVTWSELKTYFQDWPPYIKFGETGKSRKKRDINIMKVLI